MATVQALLYLAAVVLLAVASVLIRRSHPAAISCAFVAAAAALLAYSLPAIDVGLTG